MRLLNIQKKFAAAAVLGLSIAALGLTACGGKSETSSAPAAQAAQAAATEAALSAVESLEKAVEAEPKNLQNYIDLHQAYLADGDYESAMEILSDAWEAGVEDPDGKLVNLYTSLVMAVQNNPALMQSDDDDSKASAQLGSAAEKSSEKDDKQASADFSKPREYTDDTSYMELDYTPKSVEEDERYEYEDKMYWFLMNEDIRHIWEYADGEEKLVIVPGTFSDEKAAELVSLSIRGTMSKKDLATDSYCENLGKNENGLDEYKMSMDEYLGWVDEYLGYDRAEEMKDIPEEYRIFTGMGIEDFSEMDLKLSEAAECDDYVKATFDIVYKWHYSAREEETRVTKVIAYFTTERDGDYTYHVMLHADEV